MAISDISCNNYCCKKFCRAGPLFCMLVLTAERKKIYIVKVVSQFYQFRSISFRFVHLISSCLCTSADSCSFCSYHWSLARHTHPDALKIKAKIPFFSSNTQQRIEGNPKCSLIVNPFPPPHSGRKRGRKAKQFKFFDADHCAAAKVTKGKRGFTIT
jgi:hypothetical protein